MDKPIMAIVVQCYHCHSRLELDDGFRGGVCRCNKCGSLLRVPATAGTTDAERTRPADPGMRSSGNRPRDPNEDPGLSASGFRDQSSQRPATPSDTSSGAFTSSSMSSDRPQPKHSARPTPKPAVPDNLSSVPQSPIITRKVPPVRPITKKPMSEPIPPFRKNTLLLWTLVGFIILFVVAVVVVLIVVFSSHRTPAGSQGSKTSSRTSITKPTATLAFLGIPLTGKQIVFSLDGSSANLNSFNLLAACVKRTVATLGSGYEVKFALWTPHGLKVFPKQGWMNPLQAAGAEHQLLNYSPYGSTSAAKAMLATLKLGGQQIIFVTAKVFFSQSHLPKLISNARAPSQHIDVISVNGERKQLEQLARQSGGHFRFITVSDLQNALGQ